MGYSGGSSSGSSGGSSGGSAGAAGGSGGSGAGGSSGYRRVGDDRTTNLKVNNITNRDGSSGTEVDGIVEVNTTAHFIPPSGTTAERGSRGRGVFGGGYENSPFPDMNTMDYVTIATLGNAHDFGDLSVKRSAKPGGSSSTRGCFIAGRFSPTASFYNVIDYITISSTGNAFDFGDLVHTANPDQKGASNQIRTVYGGGYRDNVSNVWLADTGYFNIATKGNSSEFGSFAVAGRKAHSGSNGTRGIYSSTRGVVVGSPATLSNTIEYVNIASTGNAQDFGDTTVARSNASGSMTSSTRMVMQGAITPGYNNTIDYITMASLGDAVDFGDTNGGAEATSATSNSIRGVFNVGSPSNGNVIEHLIISTTGNSSDFGDLSAGRRIYGVVSDSHGGLG